MTMPRRKIRHSTNTLLIAQAMNSGTAGFFDVACYEFYRRHLFNSLRYFQVELHAYALLPNYVWILITARTRCSAQALLASVNNAYREYFNTRFSRQCQLWPSRPLQIPVTSDAAVLTCQKLVESEPAYSGCVTHAGQWRWSSYCVNAFGARHKYVSRHPAFTRYFIQSGNPGSNYRAYINSGFDRGQYEYLRGRIGRNQPFAEPSALF